MDQYLSKLIPLFVYPLGLALVMSILPRPGDRLAWRGSAPTSQWVDTCRRVSSACAAWLLHGSRTS
jgi:hypothetical protein